MAHQSLISRVIEVLDKVQFAEAQELNERLKMFAMQSMTENGCAQIKQQLYREAHKNLSGAYTALDKLDVADDVLTIVALLNQHISKEDRVLQH